MKLFRILLKWLTQLYLHTRLCTPFHQPTWMCTLKCIRFIHQSNFIPLDQKLFLEFTVDKKNQELFSFTGTKNRCLEAFLDIDAVRFLQAKLKECIPNNWKRLWKSIRLGDWQSTNLCLLEHWFLSRYYLFPKYTFLSRGAVISYYNLIPDCSQIYKNYFCWLLIGNTFLFRSLSDVTQHCHVNTRIHLEFWSYFFISW